MGLLDRNFVAAPGEEQPRMRLADEQTASLVQEFLESHAGGGREFAGTLAVKQGV